MLETFNLSTGTKSSPLRQNVMVLLIDDQVIVAEAMRQALHGEPDLEFHYSQDCSNAVEVARRVQPTVILQDLVMPGVDGIELVRKYRADPHTCNIPIIVLSAKEEAVVKSEAFRAGANDYIVKIPEPVELIARIRYHSGAYLMQIQRDEAYRALRRSQQELVEINLELQRLTSVDGLTALSNRRHLNDSLEGEWKHSAQTRMPISALMIDIDHFKLFNDTYGHLAGDEALQRVARVLSAACRRTADIAGRYGGEEFLLILPGMKKEDALALAKDLVCRVTSLGIAHSCSDTAPYVTVSIGVATLIPTRGQPSSVLLREADDALYVAKKNGRNQVYPA
jgi:two-component system chemotaxis family response regulator WspR